MNKPMTILLTNLRGLAQLSAGQLICALGLFSYCIGCSHAIHNMSSKGDNRTEVIDMDFSGPDFAWLVTTKGDLIRTSNGGQKWEVIQGESLGLFWRLTFTDRERGWAINKHQQVLKTTDGGLTWQVVSELGADENVVLPRRIKFVDDRNGWLVSHILVWRTEDGGNSWQKHTSFSNSREFAEVIAYSYFIDSQTGWLSGSKGGLFRTTDGGKNWLRQQVVAVGTDLGQMVFIDKKTGWVFGRLKDSIYSTKDGGQSWNPLPAPGKVLDIMSVQFLNRSEGWAVVVNNAPTQIKGKELEYAVIHTIDGGDNWERVSLGVDEYIIYRVWFVNQMSGWLFGRDNIYRSGDGG
jgi:photosystem II stability/assembly factor-like uncharacterized protein